jgi:hypothetical protein
MNRWEYVFIRKRRVTLTQEVDEKGVSCERTKLLQDLRHFLRSVFRL